MKKYICIILKGKKEPIHLSIEKWQSIIEDEKNLVAYMLDNETEWTGRVMNKLDVSYSEYDPEYTEKMNQRLFSLYRRKNDGSVVKMFDEELPDDFENYEKLEK